MRVRLMEIVNKGFPGRLRGCRHRQILMELGLRPRWAGCWLEFQLGDREMRLVKTPLKHCNIDGRPEWIRTIDLFRVKEAL